MAQYYQLIKNEAELEKITKEIFATYDIITVDTEGDLDFWNGQTVLIQIGLPNTNYLIDVRAFSDLSLLKTVLESSNITKILQNAKYDYKVLKYHFGIELTCIYDTMLAEGLLLAGKSVRGDLGLEGLARKYADAIPQKYLRAKFENNPPFFTEEMLQYAANDVSILLTIHDKQAPLLVKEELSRIAEIEFNLIPVVAEIELTGVLIDLNAWGKFTQWLMDQRTAYATSIYQAAATHVPQLTMFEDIPTINLNSWQQILKLLALFDIHPKNTRQETLKRYDHPVAEDLVEYKTYQKLVSSFGKPIPEFINLQTGRIHASFQQLGAQSGRFSCREPNLQQIPIRKTTGFRKCFIAPKGKKLITADYGQIELRIIAEWSQDADLLLAFQSGADVHKWVASKLYNKKLDEVTKEERDITKNMVYGMSYGMAAKGFARRAGIPRKEASALLKIFFSQFPTASKWLDNAGRATINSGYSKSLWNRKRWFDIPSYNQEHYKAIISRIEREGRNHAVQGSSCDMLKLAMVELFHALKPFNAKIINCIHDELVIEVDEEKAHGIANMVRNIMVDVGKQFLPSLPVEVDINVGDVWEK